MSEAFTLKIIDAIASRNKKPHRVTTMGF
jgi:hypothetical protein